MIEELIKPNDVIKIFLKRQDVEELLEHDIPWLLKGTVSKILSDTEIELVIEDKETGLEKNMCYMIYFFSYEKVFLCTAYYQSYYLEDQKRILTFELLSPLEKVQRRMHQRVSSHAKIFLHKLEEEKVKEYLSFPVMEQEDLEKMLEPVYFSEVMIDISAGGIRFTTGEHFRSGDYVFVKFDVMDQEYPLTIATYGKIIYSEPFRNEQGVLDIRLKFVGMPEALKEKIIHYVFQIEREKRRLGGRVS